MAYYLASEEEPARSVDSLRIPVLDREATLVLFRDGTAVDRLVGLTSKEALQSRIDSLDRE